MNLRDVLKGEIIKALTKMGIFDVKVDLEVPSNMKNGHYATNIAMQLGSLLGRKPIDIATNIKKMINNDEYIERIEVVNPGFINFFIKKEKLFDIIQLAVNLGDDFGKSKIGKGEKMNVEFASVNPTGVIHLGHARGSAYGDNLCRILSFAGYDVTREYYINDGGNQIDNMGVSVKERYRSLCGLDEHIPEDGYYGEEIIDIAKEIYSEHKEECLSKPVEYFKDYGLTKLLAKIKEDLSLFRVDFAVWTSEKEIRRSGIIENSLERLSELGETYEEEGALWLKSSNYGDEKDRVLIKKDGEYAYIMPDIAYHLDKLNRGYDTLIDVLGADHHGYIPRLKAAIEALGYSKDKLEVKVVQMVRMLRGGEEVKMSKRTGNVVTVSDLIEELGIDAARYYFAMRDIESKMDIDLELAIRKSHENPVYYVSYAHARTTSLLKNKDIKIVNEFKTINDEYAYDILVIINEFQNIIEIAAEKREPHLITNYVYNLANALHIYYNHERILTDDERHTNERLLLMKAVKIVIKNALNLIGVEAPNEM